MTSFRLYILSILMCAVVVGSGGCEFFTRVDRSLIGDSNVADGGAGGAAGGAGGTGGIGGVGGAGGMGGVGGSGGMGAAGGVGGMGGVGGVGGMGGMGGVGGAGGMGAAGGVGGMGGVGGVGGMGGMGGVGGMACVPIDDMNECTDDVCTVDGIAVHQPKAAGSSCVNGGSICDGLGQCVQCVGPADCPGIDDMCRQRACTSGACSMVFAAAGTPISTQTPGDCKVLVCNGSGLITSNDDNADLPNDGNVCTTDACMMGTPSHINLPSGTDCTPMGGGQPLVCNLLGQCVGCNSPTDCPGTDDECGVRSCVTGLCGTNFTPANTPVAAQTPNDCLRSVCDGAGHFINIAYNTDLPPDDGNVCTYEACANGAPVHPAVSDGLLCDDGSACTTTDQCIAGTCQSGAPVVCPAPDGCHNPGVCNAMSGACSYTNKTNGSVCDDNNACTMVDQCSAGVCNGTMAPDGGPCILNGSMGVCQAGVCNLCGNGVVDPPEECDDLNAVSGDGCNACVIELGCGPGETRVVALNNNILPIPDTGVPVLSPVTINAVGGVTRAIVVVHSLTHENTTDLDIYLRSPRQLEREISTDNGANGNNYTYTTFDDGAFSSIVGITAPFTGKYRPERSLSTAGAGIDYLRQSAAGTWYLSVADDMVPNVGTLKAWSLALCVSPTVYCGDGVVNFDEECDDGNSNNNDVCENQCHVNDGCGDGNFDLGEECDDDNVISGDGCSSSCMVELIACPVGHTPFKVTNANTANVPDDLVSHDYPVNVSVAGAVSKVVAVVGRIAHTNVQELELALQSPTGTSRMLSNKYGGTGDDYLSTFFDDDATTPIASGVAPFRGSFKPVSALTTPPSAANFYGKNGQGNWNLRIRDTQSVNFAVFHSWTLVGCLMPGAYCGNGVIDPGEECDDGNTSNGDSCSNTCQVLEGCGDGNFDAGEECDDGNVTSGDGCSSTCYVEIACTAGQTPFVFTNGTSTIINGSSMLNQYPITVATQGAIRKAIAVIGNIPDARNDALTFDLVSPLGTKRHLSSGNGGTSIGGYLSTFFDDGAPISITSGVHPLQATYRPEETISTTLNTDFRDQNPQGTWQLQVKLSVATNGTLNHWSLGLCLDTVNYCGNGVVDPSEQCDDGNTNNNDTCSNACRHVGCGDGDYDTGEQCDDGNTIAGDGCSSTCTLEMNCPAGQTGVVVANTTPTTVVKGGSQFLDIPLNVAAIGAVKKVKVAFSNIVQNDTQDLSLRLQSPFGTVRNLSIGNGGTGDNFQLTLFDDLTANTIGAAVAPFTGTYRPEQSLSLLRKKDFLDEVANGTWSLQAKNTNSFGYTGVVYGWTLGLCVDSVTYCGNGALDSGEECDDGNTINGDACSSVCTLNDGCGDGNIDAGEQCDDDNFIAGDGCSPTCQVEINCAPGETLVTRTMFGSTTIPDQSTITSSLTVTGGTVKKVVVSVGTILHTSTKQLSLSLVSPASTIRALSSANGGIGDNYVSTIFTDDGTIPVAAGTVPFTGQFKPNTSLSLIKGGDFLGQSAVGSWGLRISDNAAGNIGTLKGWTVALCLDTVNYCGNGVVNPGEECDDGNTNNADTCSNTCLAIDGCADGNFDVGERCDDGGIVAGDECSPMCQFEIACDSGQTPMILTNSTTTAIPDNNTFVNLPVNVAMSGRVRKVTAIIGNITHTVDSDLDIQLRSPSGTVRILSDDNGGIGDNYDSTIFNDTVTSAVTAGIAPFRSKYHPEQSMATTPGVDFMHELVAGTWTLEVRDDTATNVGTFNSWSLGLCILANCGNGIIDLGEECDDGNNIDNDFCNNGCQVFQGCGNGTVESSEQCDDDNLVAGDGCSSTCEVEFACAPGQTLLSVANDTSFAIPDTNTFVGAPVNVSTAGAVKKLIAVIGGITHPSDADLDVSLQSPLGTLRNLSDDNGGTKANYRSTIFDDTASTAITAGTAPFTGTFRSEDSLSKTPGTDFVNQNALGVWNLQVRDDTVGFLGTYENWRLLMCIDTVVYCGNAIVEAGEECDDGNQVDADACSNSCKLVDGCGDGNIDPGEWCDDDNMVSGDGCSSTCQVEIMCAPGQTPIIVSDNPSSPITDDNTFNSFPLSVVTSGGVKKVVVVIRNIVHTNDADLDIQLVGPSGLVRNLSDDNGGTGDNYESTFLGDTNANTYTTSITSGAVPFRGQYFPENTLAKNPNLDFSLKDAMGPWTLQVRDDTVTNTGTFNGWTLALCVDSFGYCGDGAVNDGEECDDGNTINNDACSNTCEIAIGCGSGTLDPGEQCDDDNLISGDGCSATCQFEISCGPGEVPVLLTNNQLTPIADNLTGMFSSIDVMQPGVVRKVVPLINVTHAANSQLRIYLASPYGGGRQLVSGLSGANFIATMFDDASANFLSGGSAPYTGTFRPTNYISTPGLGPQSGFGNQTAKGTWHLRFEDTTTGTVGTLNSWSLGLCIDPSVTTVCGNGFVEPGETCDDGNTIDADGCSATCQIEFSCSPGQVRIIQRSNDGPLLIPHNNATGVESTITLGDSYAVTKTLVVINAIDHRGAGTLAVTLTSPAGTAVVLSSGASSGFHFLSTIFDEAAATAIAAGVYPFRGSYNPFGNLTDVYQGSSKGAWKLKATDTGSGYGGVLKSWTIALCGE